MVINGCWREKSLTISAKTSCLTVSLGDSSDAEVYSFDMAGRLWTAMRKMVAYRRGLDGKVVAKWQDAITGQRERRWLAKLEAVKLETTARQVITDLLVDLRAGAVPLSPPISGDTYRMFERVAAFDSERYKVDVAQYHQVYRPVGILPPDQYMSVVLQVTEGCSFNTCTFCTFYRDRPFRIKTVPDFAGHIQAVREFLGDGMSLRRTIFLGDANALVVPMARLVPLLETIHSSLDVERLGGLYAFLDGFSGERKTVDDYRLLAGLGLKRVYIGMESGNPALLRFLKKPGEPQDAVQAVRQMKTAGVSVGVIFLLGAGGKIYSRAHIEDSIQAIQQMGLDADDLIYFSELIEREGMQYSRDAFQAGLTPLSSAERIAQGEEIEARLAFDPGRGVPHISRYDIREFVY
ncbi:MAG TPA: radical SAM protein [Anaerolineaceae bacterium]|nr:radical SAM protein [Anaerolineaceae bacterium]